MSPCQSPGAGVGEALRNVRGGLQKVASPCTRWCLSRPMVLFRRRPRSPESRCPQGGPCPRRWCWRWRTSRSPGDVGTARREERGRQGRIRMWPFRDRRRGLVRRFISADSATKTPCTEERAASNRNLRVQTTPGDTTTSPAITRSEHSILVSLKTMEEQPSKGHLFNDTEPTFLTVCNAPHSSR